MLKKPCTSESFGRLYAGTASVIRTSGLQTVDDVMNYFCVVFAFFCVPAFFLAFSGGLRFCCIFFAFVLHFFAFFLHFLLRCLCVWGARGSERLWEGWKCKQARRFFFFFAFSLLCFCILFALSLRLRRPRLGEALRGSGKAGDANNL